MLAFLGLCAALHELEKLLHALSNGWIQLEFDAHAETRVALDHDPVQDESLHPDFAVGYP